MTQIFTHWAKHSEVSEIKVVEILWAIQNNSHWNRIINYELPIWYSNKLTTFRWNIFGKCTLTHTFTHLFGSWGINWMAKVGQWIEFLIDNELTQIPCINSMSTDTKVLTIATWWRVSYLLWFDVSAIHYHSWVILNRKWFSTPSTMCSDVLCVCKLSPDCVTMDFSRYISERRSKSLITVRSFLKRKIRHS